MANCYLDEILYQFSFQLISSSNKDIIHQLNQTINKSKIIIIEQCDHLSDQYFILCFDKKLIIIPKKDIALINTFFVNNKDSKIYFLTAIESEIMNQIIKQDQSESTLSNDFFSIEIESFSDNFYIENNDDLFLIWSEMVDCISGYLIKKSYSDSFTDRVENNAIYFNSKNEDINLNEKEFITLRELYAGNSSSVKLIYHIKKEKLFALKKIQNPDEKSKLFDREYNNYMNVHHPYLLKCFGKYSDGIFDYLVLEYINGSSLNILNEKEFTVNEKLKILFEVLIIIEYLHNNSYIYRDLKPDNLILDKNGVAILIDLDRMILNSSNFFDNDSTQIFTDFISPEIANNTFYSFSTDIYSIGKIIQFMFHNEFKFNDELSFLEMLSNKCTRMEPKERPKISELINRFYNNCYIKITNCISEENSILSQPDIHSKKFYKYWFCIAEVNNNVNIQKSVAEIYKKGIIFKKDIPKAISYYLLADKQNDMFAQFEIGFIYYSVYNLRDINKAIYFFSKAAKQNHVDALYFLGEIYFSEAFIPMDIEKAIHYFTLAANQNHVIAQYNLGVIYDEGKYVNKNEKKAIYYYELAAKQNKINAIYNLGLIYLKGESIQRNINKALNYFLIAASHNHPLAQYNIGHLYFNGEYIEHDINKAIFYFTLAANQNDAKSQLYLGFIYGDENSNKKDIEKSIYYYTLSANQNNTNAQLNLGFIYLNGPVIKRDINKAIYYLSLAASNNNLKACLCLGYIYDQGNYISRDINKSIYYYSLAANLNDVNSQYQLGSIFYYGDGVIRDIEKAIYYYSLAAKNNDPKSCFNLAYIYYSGDGVKRDIDKSVFYFTQAGKLNISDAYFNIGLIYEEGLYTTRDIKKSLYYYSLASDQNNFKAQFNIGLIYQNGEYIKRDIKKAIKYYLLASKKHLDAYLNLGSIYLSGDYITRDVNKAIYYYLCAGNNYKAKYCLGIIYLEEKYGIKRDINKAIKYFNIAANQYYPDAQYSLGLIYFLDEKLKNINKAVHYFSLAANQNHQNSQFFMAVYFHKGEFIQKNISKAIYYYKELSSFNNNFAKNNLGVIYKDGDVVNKNISSAIIYFNEAIHQKSDALAMYNLGQIYFYGDDVIADIETAETLLIKSTLKKFPPAFSLLSLLLIKKLKFISFLKIKEELDSFEKQSTLIDFISLMIFQNIKENQLENSFLYEKAYEEYRHISYLYSYIMNCQSSEDFKNLKKDEIQNCVKMNITDEFYEGFGIYYNQI